LHRPFLYIPSMIADVFFTHGPPCSLSYGVPSALADSISEGCRVVASLRNRKAIGVVWKLYSEEEASELKDILEVIDPKPVLCTEQRRFAEWMSQYYYASIPSVLRMFLPRLLVNPDNLTIRKTTAQADETPSEYQSLLDNLFENRSVKIGTLKRKLGGETELYRKLAEMEVQGLVATAYREGRKKSAAEKLVSVSSLSTADKRLGFKQKLLLSHLQRSGKPQRMSVLIEKLHVSRKTIESLADRGLVSLKSLEDGNGGVTPQELMLNPEQTGIVKQVSEAVERSKYAGFMLYGVTGSGKTEVYVKLIWDALDMGKTALLLQPEIGLSEQVYEKLVERFGDRICRVHSAMSDSERYDVFRGIVAGDISVVIGPRSALFSPLRSIGLIIVDEEHDQSYKQGGSTPFYQGRDAAVMLARHHDCPVVLGSATPSVESWGNVLNGKYHLLEMKSRWDDRKMPEVNLVVHRPYDEHAEPLSAELLSKLEDTLTSGAQTVLFLNRRGFAPVVKCLECRTSIRCPNCDVGLVYHASKKRVMCHLCGFSSDLLDKCPGCGSSNWGYFGVGTQRIEELLRERFASANIARLDFDTAQSVAATRKLFSRFRAGKIDILVGTQMVAKGLDFPNVKLVGILGGDLAMSLPDFRALERTYALVYQASGRAGRGKFPGEVVVQVESENSILKRVTQGEDYRVFVEEEYNRRLELGYPPAKHLVMIKLKSGSAERVERAAFELHQELRRLRAKYDRFMQVLGPSPAPLFRVKNDYRWRLLLKTKSVTSTHTFLDSFMGLKSVIAALGKVKVIIDVDPYDMM